LCTECMGIEIIVSSRKPHGRELLLLNLAGEPVFPATVCHLRACNKCKVERDE
jgi:hypothetical protein